jgi:hypothetical protein
MNFLFGKKEEIQAMAEVLEDGREVANQEMKKAKYNNYKGAEPMFEVKVRVQPKDDAPFESVMKFGLTKSFLLLQGVMLQVKYQKGKNQKVELDDDNQSILERNAGILKKEFRLNCQRLVCLRAKYLNQGIASCPHSPALFKS